MSRNTPARKLMLAASAASLMILASAHAQEGNQPSPAELEKMKAQAAEAQAKQPVPMVPGQSLPNALEIEGQVFDFGDISDAEPVSHTFNFKNVSDKSVKITVAASCGCTVAGLAKDTYAPGETGAITATFSPQGRNGSQTKTLTMTVLDPTNTFAQQTMSISANVKALITVEPQKMYLTDVDHRTGKTSAVTIIGRKADFRINGVEANSEYIRATLGEPQPFEDKGEKLVKYELSVEVGKGAPIGNLNGQLSFTTNDDKLKVPTYFIGADVTGDMKATPPQAMLRVQSVSTAFESQVRIDSRSGSAFNITGIEIEGRNDMRLAADAVRGENGRYYMVTLCGYTPDQPGIVNGTVIVSTDAQGGETVRVPFTAAVRKTDLTSTGTPPAARQQPTVIKGTH